LKKFNLTKKKIELILKMVTKFNMAYNRRFLDKK
jgi:hypothetical protein